MMIAAGAYGTIESSEPGPIAIPTATSGRCDQQSPQAPVGGNPRRRGQQAKPERDQRGQFFRYRRHKLHIT
jgi:hypothetical protein